ncbi:MAG: YkgJ family cysteine cluster protein [Pseudomonadota bacterium]
MPEDLRLFLTHAQAQAAIRADLVQYAPQKPLFRELSPILLGKHTVVDDDDASGLWLETGKLGKMKKIAWSALREQLCNAVGSLTLNLPEIANLLSRVFETPATVGTDTSGRQKGIWLETGMADFSCRLCGRCCRSLDYHDQCTVQDIRRWRLAGRRDLIARARPVTRGGRIDHYRIWTSADGKHTRQTCPWLQSAGNNQFICSIQAHKPEICRQYPGSLKHARMTGCSGFNGTGPITEPCTPPSCRRGH